MHISSMVSNSQITPTYGTSLAKIKTVSCKAAGLSNEGLDSLSKARVTQGSTSAQAMKTQHASLALELSSKLASLGSCMKCADNLQVVKGGKMYHFTECYTVFECDDLATRVDSKGDLVIRYVT